MANTMKNITTPQEGQDGVNVERRKFLTQAGLVISATALGVSGLAQKVLADEISPEAEVIQVSNTEATKIEPLPSQWGIDYTKIAENPLDAILSHGEEEFRSAATEVFEDETVDAWKSMSTELWTGEISEYTVSDLKEFTPDMLVQFTRLDPKHPKYAWLWSVGNAFVASRLAEGEKV